MSMSGDTRRRWLGGVCLGISVAMLVLGTTVLKARLQRENFIYYWLACILFTAATMVIALLDFRAVRQRSQVEQKELIESTLREIARQRNAGPRDGRKGG